MNVFTIHNTLNGGDVTHWTGASVDWFSGVLVDKQFYLLLGNPSPSWSAPLQQATQIGLAVVWSTQTVFQFSAGPVNINLTFTSPQLPEDYDLMSTPSHYVTFHAISNDGKDHLVEWYFDVTSRIVLGKNTSAWISFARTPIGVSAHAMSIGNTVQNPLSSTEDMSSWGIIYLTQSTGTGTSSTISNAALSRAAFVAGKPLPSDSIKNPQPAFTPGIKKNTLAAASVYSLSVTASAVSSSYVVISIDEILSINWFGELMPPFWRRALPVGSTNAPVAMLTKSFYSYDAVKSLCNDFDATTDATLTQAGDEHYSTIAQLTYRQVWAGQQLVFSPTRNTMWFFLKEISSCGCLQTSDVIYPAFPQVLYYAPELAKLWTITHLEYAMNFTSSPYPYPWAPHHLGHWPLANLPASKQENMPLEETAWNMLIIAAVAQRQGGDVTWLQPYWPAIQTWYTFLITLLPFPQTQLSTDDFDGVLYNATNLAVKGVAAIAAYGYIVEKFTGNASEANVAYALAAQYSQVMVDYSWNTKDGHFMIGYTGSRGDGGDPDSWPMLYNALWLRVLGLEFLIPTKYIDDMGAWYMANKMQKYGLPLNSRKLYTKDDWMMFLAATYYTRTAPVAPSAFTTALFQGLFNWANETTSRVPLSDWTNTDSPSSVGFVNRPVYGAMYAPLLVVQAGAAPSTDPSIVRANAIFRQSWEANGFEF